MTDLDDKLRGEKNVDYVSDSDDEDRHSDSGTRETKDAPEEINDLPGFGSSGPKTGPKGVLEDYKRFQEVKRLESIESAKKQIADIKKHAFTADPNKCPDQKEEDNDDDNDDDFLKTYHKNRLAELQKEMAKQNNKDLKKFDKLFELSGKELLSAIENEDRKVFLVVHLYEASMATCQQMNKCLEVLVKQYPYVKFCKVRASDAGLSLNFRQNALPTLQVYKEGTLIGNFIKMKDKLDEEFYPSDVENFLIDSDMLASSTNFSDDLASNDFELD